MRAYPIPQQPPTDEDRARELLTTLTEAQARELLAKLEAGDVIPLRKRDPAAPPSKPRDPAPAQPWPDAAVSTLQKLVRSAAEPLLNRVHADLASLGGHGSQQDDRLADIDRRISRLEQRDATTH